MGLDTMQTRKRPGARAKCETCGGMLASFPVPESSEGGWEVRCLMCGRVAYSDLSEFEYEADGAPKANIRLSRPASQFLRQLLRGAGRESSEAFRLEFNQLGARVVISRRQPGDLKLPERGDPLLFISRSAARELDGSIIGLKNADGHKRIAVLGGSQGASARKTA